MPKFARIEGYPEDSEEYVFDCPGCHCSHWVRVSGPNPCWSWNGDVNKPTVSPSVHVLPGTEQACHSFITDGKIQFLGDSHHHLKGQTVELPDCNEA